MAEKKPHPASDKKKEKARKDGQVLKSQILTQSFGVVSVVFILYALSSTFFSKIQETFRVCWLLASKEFQSCTAKGVNLGFFSISLILFSLILVSIASDFFQIGFKLEWSIIKFKAKNFNLGKGFVNLFKKIKDSFSILLKVITFLLLVSFSFYYYRGEIFYLFSSSREEFPKILSSLMLNILSLLSLVIIMVGGIDYFFKHRKYHSDLSMSEQEVRDEYKEVEGDPYIKAQRQAMHEELMYKDIVKRVKECKVILVDRNK